MPNDPESSPIEVDTSAANQSRGLSPLVKVLVVFTLLGGALSLLTRPDDFRGRELRVEGDLKPKSIAFREDPCEYRFVLSKEGKEMPVRFPQCIVPDTFKDGVGLQVAVQGKLTTDGYFLANKVIAKCPSKYEMQERQKKGENVPHTMPRS
jgi:cytochrome c-type biogenesis protein CcmE